jgi:outer membrane protein assembly factor BamB
MPASPRLLALLAAAVCMNAAEPAASNWPTPRGDIALTAATGPLPAELAKRWTWEAGSPMDQPPAIAGGAVFVATTKGVVASLDLATGKERWRREPQPKAGALFGPAVAGGLVVVSDNAGTVEALDAATGQPRWRVADLGTLVRAPNAGAGVVVLGTDEQKVICLELASGKQRWVWTAEGDKAYIRSTPCLTAEVALVAGCDGAVHALRLSDGTERELVRAQHFGSSPAVHAGVVYIGSVEGEAIAVGLADGKERWRAPTELSKITADPAVSAAVAVLVGERGAVALDPATGAVRWRLEAAEGNPAIAGDRVFLAAEGGVLQAYDLATGKPGWRWRAGASITSPAIAGGHLVIGTGDGAVHAFAAPAAR